MARPLVQVTLPHTDQGDIPAYTRTCGNLKLTIQPTIIRQEDGAYTNYGIPYGSIPRLVLAWLSTEAVRTRSREIGLGDNLSAFLKTLDLAPQTGKRGTMGRARKQITRLFTSSFIIMQDETNNLAGPGRMSTIGFRLSDEYSLLWNPLHPDQIGRFSSKVTLSEKFYRTITDRPVPVDMRILRQVQKSPLAIDIYTWLTYRMSYLTKACIISWPLLAMQFGSGYSEMKVFKFKFAKRLRAVLEWYQVNVQIAEDGLVMQPSKPSVKRGK